MATPQTVYGTNNPPGGGSAFFAGLEELWNAPASFFTDAANSPIATVATAGVFSGNLGAQGGTWVPAKNAAGGAEPGGGSSVLAGIEEAVNAPGQFLSDVPVPSTSTISTWLVLAVLGILGVAYIAHKA